MKIHVEIDITPEELRKLYGVPDMTKLQTMMIEQINEKLTGADMESLTQFLRPAVSEGMKAVDAYQKFLGGIIKYVPGNVADMVKAHGDDDAEEEAPQTTKKRAKVK